MVIDLDILEKACKEMIATILLCLNQASKGTIYRVGPMPRLQTVRITSGVRVDAGDGIRWGVDGASDYSHPGKNWEQYRDTPGRIVEAMAWCVEKQKSWTSDNPQQDPRSVRKQLKGETEDFHHMEPVLVRKSDLQMDRLHDLKYPLDCHEEPIWQDTEYVVVAVIKIHFLPNSVRCGDTATKIIKQLSRTLGTELLSLHMREISAEAQKELTRLRLQCCNVLAHELRNTVAKLGFVFQAINAELSFLREQWEDQVELTFPELGSRKSIIARLNHLLVSGSEKLDGARELVKLSHRLFAEQQELAGLFVMPQFGEKWLDDKIKPKWDVLLSESQVWDEHKGDIHQLLKRLGTAIWIGMDENLARKMRHLPDDLRSQWPRVAYMDFTMDKLFTLEEVLKLFDHPALNIPHKHQSKKVLTSLKVLAEMAPEVAEKTNRIINALKNGVPLEEH